MATESVDDPAKSIAMPYAALPGDLGTVVPQFVDLTTEYEVIEELGRGSSAVVYRARDRMLEREVAIKIAYAERGVGPFDAQLSAGSRAGSAADDPVARLMREARVVTQLHHPNVVDVLAVRHLADGGVALIMQLVHGRTLRGMLRERGALAPAEVVRILADVARALAAAHERGIVHRDVKPENVFVDDVDGRALLSDFGIARWAEPDVRLTQTGIAVGTPAYMSPEQIDGIPVDGRSDLYALGMVAWELLTGQRPWEGEGLFAMLSKQKYERLPPIAAIRPADREIVPPPLEYIVERLTAKAADDRFASATALLVQLDGERMPADYERWEAEHGRRVAAYQRRPARGPGGVDIGADTMRLPRREAATPPPRSRRTLAIALAISAVATGALAPLRPWERLATKPSRPATVERPSAERPSAERPSAERSSARRPTAEHLSAGRASARRRAVEPPVRPTRTQGVAEARAVRVDSATRPAASDEPRSLRERLAALLGRSTPATTQPAPARAVAPHTDTAGRAAAPEASAVVGTWYFGDRRSAFDDSITLVLRADASASMLERRYRLSDRGGWRASRVAWSGRWEVRQSTFPLRGPVELCTQWRTPQKVVKCAPLAFDTLPTYRMLTFGGRYWRSTRSKPSHPPKQPSSARRQETAGRHAP